MPLSCGAALFVSSTTALAEPYDPDKVNRERSPGAHDVIERDVKVAEDLEDPTTKPVSAEMGVYKDNDGVTVFTPSVSAGIENVDGASVRGTYLVDAVSAASADILSTASRGFHEVRQASSLYGQYKPKDFGVGVGGSVSAEPDYVAYGGFATVTRDFDEKNWTLILGGGLAHDTVGRCGGQETACTAFSVFSRDVWRGTLNAGVNWVVDRASTLSLTGDAILERGDQSKPYRYVPMFAANVAPTITSGESVDDVNKLRLAERPLEQLPLRRDRYALSLRYARRMGEATLRLQERGYTDSWGLLASTTDARWVFDVNKRLSVWPHLRVHVQKGVNFWQLAYVSGPGWNLPEYRTGDRELGPLVTAVAGGGMQWSIGSAANPDRWALQLAADGMYTSFFDALYLSSRVAMLGSLSLAGTF